MADPYDDVAWPKSGVRGWIRAIRHFFGWGLVYGAHE